MFCRNCGSELREGAMFCPNCGNKVGQVEGKETVNVPIKEEKIKTTVKEENTPNIKKYIPMIAIIIVVFIVGIAVFGGSKDTPTNVADGSEYNQTETQQEEEQESESNLNNDVIVQEEQDNQVQIPTQDKYNGQGVLLKWIEKLDIVDDSSSIVGEVTRYNNSENQTYYNEVVVQGGEPILNFSYSSKESLEYYLTPYGNNEVNLCSENGDYMLQVWIYENGINEDWHFTDNFITNLGMNYGWMTRPANGYFFEDRNEEYVKLIFEVDDGIGKKGYEGVLYEKNKETILHFVYAESYSVYDDERARAVVDSISTNIITN